MQLECGVRLGSYEIIARIGAGATDALNWTDELKRIVERGGRR